ncbi:MAG: iron-sulfur cluster insertion protein ErpA [Rhodospirillales bacterium]|nr:iron-sulfur cluster insertion protein ErpA [Rhodospirillales bacterium]
MAETAAAVAPAAFSLTENAARRVRSLIAQQDNPAMMLRIGISGGGCSGFQYSFALDDSRTDEDVTFDEHGVRVVIDTTSLDLVRGAQLDFIEDLVGASFHMRNPNATSTCGCGSSFSV